MDTLSCTVMRETSKCWCVECTRIYKKKYNAKNRLKIAEYNKKYKTTHKEEVSKAVKSYYLKNKVKIDNYTKTYYQAHRDEIIQNVLDSSRKNRGLSNYRKTMYKKKVKKATPKWLSVLQLQEIRNIYVKAKELEQENGIERHVDHIIPIQGKNVCGLHVPWNLQVLTAVDNLTKGNRYVS